MSMNYTVKNNTEWELEDLGVIDEFVYDIETENHMFFANDILNHNSNYMDLTDILNKFYLIKPDATRNEATDFIDKFCKDIETKCLAPLFDKIKNECNAHPGGGMFMDREAICIPYRKTGFSALWTAKKRYIAMVSDMEDFRYDEPHRKIMGMYSVTSECPAFVKPVYNKVLEDLIKEGVDTARKTIKDFKDVFYAKSIEEIGMPKGVSNVTKFVNPKTGLPWDTEDTWTDPEDGKQKKGGVPIHCKAAINHNYMVQKLGLEKKYQLIKEGDKIKFVHLSDNPYKFSVMAFKEDFPVEFELSDYVNYDMHWDKIFYSKINDIFTVCGLNIDNTPNIFDFF